MSWRKILDKVLNAGRDPATTLPKELAQIRVITSISLVYMLSGSLLVLFHFTKGIPAVAWVISTGLVLGFINLLTLYYKNHVGINAHATVAIIFAAGLGSNMIWGGYSGPNFSWLLFIPILAALVISCRAMWAYFVILVLTMTGLIFAEKNHVLPLYENYIPNFALAVIINRFGILALLCTVLQAFYTERMRYENGVIESNRRIRMASHEKDEFIGTITHEILTPMTDIMGMTELLMKTKLTSDQKHYTNMIHQSGGQVISLVNDTYDYSKIETGRLKLREKEFDFRLTIQNTLSVLTKHADQKNIQLTSSVQHDMPALISGDENRYKQILSNLVGNSIKFTDRGGVNVKVTHTILPDHSIKITTQIIDSGIGIGKTNLLKIAKSLNEADSNILNIFGGVGLGLTISGRLTHLMGGEIFLESEIGKGTIFTFTCKMKLPIAVKASSERSNEQAKFEQIFTFTHPPTEQEEWAQRTNLCGHILVAEDNAINQALIRSQLDLLKVTCEIVTDGQKAIDALSGNRHYDLVIMDCQMPHMDGITATEKIRATAGPNQHIPIIALTADALSYDVHRCISAGMDDFIIKPFRQVDFHQVLARWLKSCNNDNNISDEA